MPTCRLVTHLRARCSPDQPASLKNSRPQKHRKAGRWGRTVQLSGHMEQGRQCCAGEWRAEQKWGAAIEGDATADRGPALSPACLATGTPTQGFPSAGGGVLCLSLQNHSVSFSRGAVVGPSLLTSLRTPNKTELRTCLLDSTELSQPLWRLSIGLWVPHRTPAQPGYPSSKVGLMPVLSSVSAAGV